MAQRKSNKESHAQLFNRYIWLIDLIYSRRRITFEEIADRWQNSSLNSSGDELPLRTFHNHRGAIQTMFDVDILCDKRAGYLYYIENSDDLERGGVRQCLVSTFAVNNLINESHKLKNRILFEQIPSGQNYLTQIIKAMRDGTTLEMTYQSFWRDNSSTFLFEPYSVKVFKQRWYAIGRSVYEDKIRLYSLDRIHKLSEFDEKYIFPKDFDASEHFHNSFGIIASDDIEPQEVQIKAFYMKAKYFETLPLHHSQSIVERHEEFTIFKYWIKPTYDFRQELLSHGAEVAVLSPKWFRNEIAEIVEEQCKYYR